MCTCMQINGPIINGPIGIIVLTEGLVPTENVYAYKLDVSGSDLTSKQKEAIPAWLEYNNNANFW